MAKRIFLISDTHLGCRSNSVLWLNIIEDYFFNFFIPLVKREYREGDVLYHLGDVFDNRQSINLAAQDLGIRVFEALSEIFPEIHVIVGNHDIMRKNSNEISSVDCIKYVPNVTVHKEPILLEYEHAKCLLVPWRRNPAHELETLNEYKQKIDYAFCHSETQGVQTSPSKRHLHEGGNPVNVFKRFKQVYSGHIHYRQEKGNFVLVGNPYQMTRSDRGNRKGVYVLDLESGQHKFYENDHSPEFLRYYISDLFEVRMADLAEQIKNNFVDVYIPSKFLLTCSINQFMNQLDGLAHRLEPKIYDEEYAAEYEDGELTDFSGDIDLIKIAEEYIAALDYDKTMKKRLVNSIKQLYKEATTSRNEDY